MARYIDVDKAIARIEASPAFPNFGQDGYFLREVILNILDGQPTAYVAPRAEVVREIFGEIEKATNNHIKAISMLEPQNDYCAGGKKALDITLKVLAELKKKYTEAHDEND